MSWMEVGNQIEDGKWEITEMTTKMDNGKRLKIVTFAESVGGSKNHVVSSNLVGPVWPKITPNLQISPSKSNNNNESVRTVYINRAASAVPSLDKTDSISVAEILEDEI